MVTATVATFVHVAAAAAVVVVVLKGHSQPMCITCRATRWPFPRA